MIYSDIANDLNRSLENNLIGVIVVGSFAWSPSKRTRDIDIDIIVDKFESLKTANLGKINNYKISATLKSFIFNSLDKILAMDIQMFSLKFFQGGTEISLRFSESGFFDSICNLDLSKVKNTISIPHFRTAQTHEIFDNQKNFIGQTIHYKNWVFKNGQGYLIEAPIVIIDKDGGFYPGQIIDRFLALPKVICEKDNHCSQNLDKLLINVVKRLLFEQNKTGREKLHVDNCLCRSERIGDKNRLLLRHKEKSIVKILGEPIAVIA